MHPDETGSLPIKSSTPLRRLSDDQKTSYRQASLMHIIEKHIRSMNCVSYRDKVGNPILDFAPKKRVIPSPFVH